jgi:RNA polymerase sigma factor (sigma-70 family)
MNDAPDAELLQQFARNQSEAAFAELVQRHIGLVYSTAFRKTENPQQAEDVTQAVFIILGRKAGSLSPKTVLPGWLYHTTRLTTANLQRAEIRRIRREQEAFMQSTTNETASDELWSELSPLLEDAMAGLRASDRDAIVLRYFQNRSLAEVGIALGSTEAAAKMRVNRALEKLRKFFTKRGIDSSPAIIAGAISNHSVQAAPVALAKSVTAVAIAKGATATITTLTLAKGALKLMAWTKTKTIIAATAAALLVGGASIPVTIVTIHVVQKALAPNIAGDWEGVFPLGGPGINPGDSTSTRVVVKLKKEWGKYTATFDAIDVGRTNLPLAGVVYDFPNIQLSVYPKRNMVYQGKMNPAATRMDFSGIILRKTHSPPTYTPLAEDDFASRAAQDIQGYWKGAVLLMPVPKGNQSPPSADLLDSSNALPIDLKIAGNPDGTYRAELDNPMQGAEGLPASVTVNQGNIKLVLNSHSGMLRLALDGSGQELSGSYVQNGQPLPAFFKRANYLTDLAQQEEADFSSSSPADLPGHWIGSWDVILGNTKVNIPMKLDIAKMPDGTYSAAIANLEQLGNDSPTPASRFEYLPPNLHAEWKWSGNTKYDGKLENGKIVGTWSEGGGGFPLVFERTNN